jgi:polysaccharide biosynthesis transport protein
MLNGSPDLPEIVPRAPDGATWNYPLAGVNPAGGSPMPSPLLRHVDAVLRRKWLILVLTIVGTGAGVAASFMVPPRYQSQATVWIEGGARPRTAGDGGPIRPAELLQSYAWIELLKSYTVLEPVVVERKLFLDPKDPADLSYFDSFRPTAALRPGAYQLAMGGGGGYTLSTDDGTPLQSGSAGQPVGAVAGFEWLPPPPRLQPGQVIRFYVSSPRDVAQELGDMLQATMARDGSFLRISLQGSDPVRVAGTVNDVTARYLEVAAQLKRTRLDELSALLLRQLAFAEDALRQAEIDLEGFRVQTVTLPSDQSNPITAGIQLTRSPVFDSFFELRVTREEQRQERQTIERILEQFEQERIALDALAAIPAVRGSAEIMRALDERTTKRADLRMLELRYTDENPQVRRMRDEIFVLERRTIPELARDLLSQLRMQETELDDRVLAASEELRRIPPRAIEEARLQRRVTISDNLYTTLKQRFEEARLGAESSIPDVRLLDAAAVPHSPVQNRRRLVVLLGFIGGLGLSVVGAGLLGRVDPKLRYPEQVLEDLGLPIIAAVPHRSGEDAAAQSLEAFREIRLILGRGSAATERTIVTITSPESGDGKSFVAENLARSFAGQGMRTLLIDGDVRRGSLNRSFGLERTPGLTDVLRREARLNEVIRPTAIPSLFVLPGGRRSQDAPDLLTGPPLLDLFKVLSEQFQVILVDTPPLGAGMDPFIFAIATGRVAVVLRANRTNRAFMAAKQAVLERFPIRLEGVILNDVPPSTIYRYYSYLPEYTPIDEVETMPLVSSGQAS